MLKQIAVAIALATAALPALAQNAEEIARVQDNLPCEGCNLFQADLSFRDLPGANVANSRLRQADLSLATMNEADFHNANLSIANMFGGRFTSANFQRANLERAVMVGAYFGSADFTDATLTGANLSGADLKTTRGLTQAQLDTACGDETTQLPTGLSVPRCQ